MATIQFTTRDCNEVDADSGCFSYDPFFGRRSTWREEHKTIVSVDARLDELASNPEFPVTLIWAQPIGRKLNGWKGVARERTGRQRASA